MPNEDEAACLRTEISPRLSITIHGYGLPEERRQAFAQMAGAAEVRRTSLTISFVGAWSPRKGAKDWGRIVRLVWAQIPDARFLFLGTLTEDANVFRELGFSESKLVSIVPEYQPDDLPGLLSASVVGGFPTYAEGFGFALLEQLASGIPTVAYDSPGPRSILTPDLLELLVPAGDVEKFSTALVRILQMDAASYERLPGKAGRQPIDLIGAQSPVTQRNLIGAKSPADIDFAEMKNPTVLHVVPRLPGSLDGVGTYASNLANELLAKYGALSQFVAGNDLARFHDSAHDAVLLHYVNYGYHDRGVPFHLPARCASCVAMGPRVSPQFSTSSTRRAHHGEVLFGYSRFSAASRARSPGSPTRVSLRTELPKPNFAASLPIFQFPCNRSPLISANRTSLAPRSKRKIRIDGSSAAAPPCSKNPFAPSFAFSLGSGAVLPARTVCPRRKR